MDRTVKQVIFPAAKLPKLKKVAAYARVSSGKDAMLHSLSAQVSYYSNLIQNHKGWQYVGVYSDEALTGTKDNHENFQRMLYDCKARKIDMIITKSISRFARNTVTLLETVRELKALGVDVFFEEQNIHTMSADGELMLTILASYAQEESLSVSENQKWRIKKNFEEGKPWNGKMLGYRYDNGKYIIIPNEAETVRLIFDYYINGMSAMAITKLLNVKNITSGNGNPWCKNSVLKVLRNYAYTGNLLLQTTYHENHLTKREMVNGGQLPKYHVKDSHEAIIDLATFEAVQDIISQRAGKHNPPGQKKQSYLFTGMIVCGICGKHYRRKVTATRINWICPTYNMLGKSVCASKQIPEDILHRLTAEVLGTEDFNTDALNGKITAIKVEKDNTLVFCFRNGDKALNDGTTVPGQKAGRKRSVRACSAEKFSGGSDK